jgi:hypothetical protein
MVFRGSVAADWKFVGAKVCQEHPDGAPTAYLASNEPMGPSKPSNPPSAPYQ